MMKFLFPDFLWAFTAITIPVIIHFFNFRRYRNLYFSNVQFLKNIHQETRSRSRIRQILILISRILAIAALVLAFAQPYMPVDNAERKVAGETVGIYIDNSFSMDAENTFGNMLEVAKTKASEIAGAYRPGTKFILLTNNFDARHQHDISREQFTEYAAGTEAVPARRYFSEIISRFRSLAGSGDSLHKRKLYVLSDFQKNIFDPENSFSDTNIVLNLMPMATGETSNLYVDSCWFETPARKYDQAEDLFFRICNHSEESYLDIPVNVFINDSLKAFGSFNISPGEKKICMLSYTNTARGNMRGKITITDYPVVYDNEFFFNYMIQEQIRVLNISTEKSNRYLHALFSDDPFIQYESYTLKNINYSTLPDFDVIILSNIDSLSTGMTRELYNYVQSGGTVVLIPAIKGSIGSYNSLLKYFGADLISGIDTSRTVIKKLNTDHPVFRNSFLKLDERAGLPHIGSHYVFSHFTGSSSENLLTARNGHVLLNQTNFKEGSIFCLAFPLDGSSESFTGHPLFVPVFYNIALNSNPSGPLYYTLEPDLSFDIRKLPSANTCVPSISAIDTSNEFIPMFRVSEGVMTVFPGNEISRAGNYIISCEGKMICGLAFNHNRDESDISFYKKDEIEQQLTDNGFSGFSFIDVADRHLSKTVEQLDRGNPMWKLFVLLALLFVLIEILLIRFLK
ncbi:MAG: BatA domain-containing protein [Bacteroidota bacterium]